MYFRQQSDYKYMLVMIILYMFSYLIKEVVRWI